MTPERWQQIEEIFHEALDLDEPARRQFVEERAGDDVELCAEVNKLLEQFEDASSFIEQPLIESGKNGVLANLLDDVDDDPMVGKVLGSYRIEREIGRGGMGAVYEAVRADGEFRLRVALKVVKRGVDTDFVLRRFRNERQILAALDHPYITRLIDGGTTEDGRPYFVMEYIDGFPLYRYCDKQRLSVDERVELFCRVAEAVEYAHQRRVIHRDLKPSNIFITVDGAPRLLDFGIAKLLDPDLASNTLQPTATALRMMTVDYASPEQVRGEKVTYATDVYSLGVILFELLTGFRPYRLESRTAHNVARAICDDRPMRPSEVFRSDSDSASATPVNTATPTLADVADLRRESPAQLSARIAGDLDNIILRALAKDPSDRYPSVSALREDIEHYLRGEGVDARLVSREPTGRPEPVPFNHGPQVAVLPLTILNPGGQDNTGESYLTVGLADAIITRLTSVNQLTVRPTSSITRYDESQINPFRAGRELGVDFVLDGRIRRFGERLRISLQLLDVNKVCAIWAGHFDEHLTDFLELEDKISKQVAEALIPQLTGEQREKLSRRGTNDPRAYECYLRGRFYWNQFTSQSLPRALDAYRAAVDLDPDYALAHLKIGEFYIWANIYGLIPPAEAYEQAEVSIRRALEIDRDLGAAYAAQGLVAASRYEFEKAESLLLRAIELDPHNAISVEWYAALLISIGRFTEGVINCERAEQLDPLSLRTKVLVGWYKYQAGLYDEALAKIDEVIAIDPNYPQGHIQRGNLLARMGRGEEAVTAMEHSVKLMPGASLAEVGLAFAYAGAGRHEDAAKVADEMEARSKTEHIKAMFLFYAHYAAGRTDRALDCLETAVDEYDPWVFWLATDARLADLRENPRFLDLVRRTNREIVDGRPRAIKPDTLSVTAPGIFEAVTEPMFEQPTAEYVPGFFRRNLGKIGVAVTVLAFAIVGYWSGYIGISIRGTGLGPEVSAATRSIAVVPFRNRTGDAGNDYISDGLGESLLRRLSTSPEIRAVPRDSVFKYKTREMTPQEIGRELGVEEVISGALMIEDAKFALAIEMIDVATGRKIVALNFAESPDRIFALQDMMSAKVADALSLRRGTAASKPAYTANNEAFQMFLKGEYSRQKGSPTGISEALDLYRGAIARDPNYALAYQGLALTYRSAPAYGVLAPQEAMPLAKESAEKALSLDPGLAAAYVSLASIKATYDWDFAGAETQYKQAIQLAPTNAEAHYSYGNFLVAMGRSDEALIEFRNALQIDPQSLNIQTNIAWAHYIAGRYDEAIAQIRSVIARDPSFARAYMNLAEILQEQGKFDESISSLMKARDLSKDPLLDMALGHVYAAAGRTAEARTVVADLEEKVRQKQVSPFLPAVVYAGLNEKDKAFYWLERAYQERSNWLTLIKVGRRLKSLRGDPRFDDLLQRIGFPA
jgi:serine/threonine protein kinase/tetratricopeptide (TPR) repeat protein